MIGRLRISAHGIWLATFEHLVYVTIVCFVVNMTLTFKLTIAISNGSFGGRLDVHSNITILIFTIDKHVADHIRRCGIARRGFLIDLLPTIAGGHSILIAINSLLSLRFCFLFGADRYLLVINHLLLPTVLTAPLVKIQTKQIVRIRYLPSMPTRSEPRVNTLGRILRVTGVQKVSVQLIHSSNLILSLKIMKLFKNLITVNGRIETFRWPDN